MRCMSAWGMQEDIAKCNRNADNRQRWVDKKVMACSAKELVQKKFFSLMMIQ